MDGLVKMNSSYSSCVVIYRGFNGVVKGCFALCLGHQIVFFFTKLYAFILTIEVVFCNDWRWIWLESDFSPILLIKDYNSLGALHNKLVNCLHLLKEMEFKGSHIYIKKNLVVDSSGKHRLSCNFFFHLAGSFSFHLEESFIRYLRFA